MKKLYVLISSFFKKSENKKIFISVFIVLSFFIVSFTVKYVVENIIYQPNDNVTQITKFQFYYTDDIDELSTPDQDYAKYKETSVTAKLGESGKFNFSDVPQGKYYRIHYTRVYNEQTTFIINSDYTPMKILLDGRIVVDNGFGTEDFVGNKHNSFNIPSSPSRDQSIDIYMYVPFSLAFNMTLQPYVEKTTASNILTMAGVIAGCSVIFLGLILLLSSILVSLRNKMISKLLMLGGSTVICGASILFSQLSEQTNLLSGGEWFNFIFFFNILIPVMLIGNVVFCFDKWTVQICIGLASMFTCGIISVFMTSAVIIKVIAVMELALGIFTSVFVIKEYKNLLEQRVKYAQAIFITFMFVVLLNIGKSIIFIIGMGPVFGVVEVLCVLLFSLILFIAFFRQSMFFMVSVRERQFQLSRDSKWIESIAVVLARIFIQKNIESFFISSAEGLCSIIENNAENELSVDRGRVSGDLFEIPNVKACIGVYEQGHFREIYNNGNIENCDYELISSKYTHDNLKTTDFAGSYFDLMFVRDDIVNGILHFENITNGLSDHFENIITTAYASMSVAYVNFGLKNDMVLTQENVFLALAETVEFKSGCKTSHLKIVSEITRILALQLGFSEDESRLISSAAMVHDIGKIALPEGLLNKDGKLTFEEKEIVKQHTINGYNILSQSPGEFMAAAAIIAKEHHEHFDGSGYNEIKGNNIHIYARIVSVADVFDALTSVRPYKEAWANEEAIKYMNDNSGKEFDPRVIKAFNKSIDDILVLRANYFDSEITIEEGK